MQLFSEQEENSVGGSIAGNSHPRIVISPVIIYALMFCVIMRLNKTTTNFPIIQNLLISPDAHLCKDFPKIIYRKIMRIRKYGKILRNVIDPRDHLTIINLVEMLCVPMMYYILYNWWTPFRVQGIFG